MSDSQSAGFGKFVPGFDFLQNLAKGASQSSPQMPNLASWIAPTLNVEELDKRISELKTVHFWLEQNSKALGATVQALEVQKMTLATLKGMNVNIGEMANAFKLKAADLASTSVPRASGKTAPAAKTIAELAADAEAAAQKIRDATQPATATPAAAGLVDPMQLWGSLTQQFQQIAASAMKDVGKKTAMSIPKKKVAEVVKKTETVAKKVTASASKPKAAAKTEIKTIVKPVAKPVAKKVVRKTTDRNA